LRHLSERLCVLKGFWQDRDSRPTSVLSLIYICKEEESTLTQVSRPVLKRRIQKKSGNLLTALEFVSSFFKGRTS
jgi:hypothetical protein